MDLFRYKNLLQNAVQVASANGKATSTELSQFTQAIIGIAEALAKEVDTLNKKVTRLETQLQSQRQPPTTGE